MAKFTLLSENNYIREVEENVAYNFDVVQNAVSSGFIEAQKRQYKIDIPIETLDYIIEILSLPEINKNTLAEKFKIDGLRLNEIFTLREYSKRFITKLFDILNIIIIKFIEDPQYQRNEDKFIYDQISNRIKKLGKYVIYFHMLHQDITDNYPIILSIFETAKDAQNWIIQKLLNSIVKQQENLLTYNMRRIDNNLNSISYEDANILRKLAVGDSKTILQKLKELNIIIPELLVDKRYNYTIKIELHSVGDDLPIFLQETTRGIDSSLVRNYIGILYLPLSYNIEQVLMTLEYDLRQSTLIRITDINRILRSAF